VARSVARVRSARLFSYTLFPIKKQVLQLLDFHLVCFSIFAVFLHHVWRPFLPYPKNKSIQKAGEPLRDFFVFHHDLHAYGQLAVAWLKDNVFETRSPIEETNSKRYPFKIVKLYTLAV